MLSRLVYGNSILTDFPDTNLHCCGVRSKTLKHLALPCLKCRTVSLPPSVEADLSAKSASPVSGASPPSHSPPQGPGFSVDTCSPHKYALLSHTLEPFHILFPLGRMERLLFNLQPSPLFIWLVSFSTSETLLKQYFFCGATNALP